MAKQKITYRLPNPLVYRLSNPNYTIYHRAALGGLAATIHAWGAKPPEGINADLQRDEVRLSWDEALTDQEAVRRILDASFKLTRDYLIDLPGQQIGVGRDDMRVAIHDGIMSTFLQFHTSRSIESESRIFVLRSVDDDEGLPLKYRGITNYARQPLHEALARIKFLNDDSEGRLPAKAKIPQWLIPGAFEGSHPLEGSTEEILLLMFLIVGCSIFNLRPRNHKDKAKYCVIVPDVIDLIGFAKALAQIAVAGQGLKRFSNTYLGRLVGGSEEAALLFLVDLEAEDATSYSCVAGGQAIAMGKVSWDPKQTNRSVIASVKGDYAEMQVFKAAATEMSGGQIIKTVKGDKYITLKSSLPELIAANLAAERHWCANLRELVSDQKQFDRLRYFRRGLRKMKEAIKDAEDQAIIRAFQEAWRLTMRGLYERADSRESDEQRDLSVRRERVRNEILRAKTSEALAGWFLRFCANATKDGGSLKSLREEGEIIRKFIFNPRNFERFQNLCLFALVSYASEESKPTPEGATNHDD